MGKKKKLIIGIVAILLILVVGSIVSGKIASNKAVEAYKNSEDVSYTTFLEYMDEGRVDSVHVNFAEKRMFFYMDSSEEAVYETENPMYAGFKKDLLESGVEVVTLTTPGGNVSVIFSLIQSFLLFGFLFFMFSKMNPTLSDKKTAALSVKPNIKFSDIAGLDESKADIEHLVNFLKKPKEYKKAGAKLPKGVVLYGPPGTGKTLTAKAIAGEANVPFLSVSGSDFVEMYVGLGAKRVRKLFKEAREKAPCIIFIDEIDALGSKRNSSPSSGEANQTINALLAEMDGFETKEGIVVIAATNRISDLDDALVRPGRFDRHVAINLPDMDGRKSILKLHARDKKLSDDVNLEEWAKLTIGFSGAALEMLLNESAINAVNEGRYIIETIDIEEAYYKIIMKGNKKNRGSDKDEEEVKLIAYHEAGHALAAKKLTENDVPRVTIIPSTNGAGGVTFNIPKKMGLLSKREFLASIKVLYAGRASEEILRGDKDLVTTGASSDIERATNYLKAYFEDFGFSEEFGMIQLSQISDAKLYAESAKKLSKELYEETKQLLLDNWAQVEKISEELLKKETLTGEDLEEIIDKEKES